MALSDKRKRLQIRSKYFDKRQEAQWPVFSALKSLDSGSGGPGWNP